MIDMSNIHRASTIGFKSNVLNNNATCGPAENIFDKKSPQMPQTSEDVLAATQQRLANSMVGAVALSDAIKGLFGAREKKPVPRPEFVAEPKGDLMLMSEKDLKEWSETTATNLKDVLNETRDLSDWDGITYSDNQYTRDGNLQICRTHIKENEYNEEITDRDGNMLRRVYDENGKLTRVFYRNKENGKEKEIEFQKTGENSGYIYYLDKDRSGSPAILMRFANKDGKMEYDSHISFITRQKTEKTEGSV